MAMARVAGSVMSMVIAWALGAGTACAYTLVSQQDHFLIEMPAAPQFQKTSQEEDGVAYDVRTWSVLRGQTVWVAAVGDMAKFKDHEITRDDVRSLADETLKRVDCTRRSRHTSSVDGVTGLEYVGNCPSNLVLHGRIFAVEREMFIVYYMGPKGTETGTAALSFLNSLHFLRH